jgi:catalase
LNKGFPAQASQNVGKGFFTAPGRRVGGNLVRKTSPTFADHWSQPRLFYNSLSPVEQQFLINAIRFETSHLKSEAVKKNVLTQLNKISNDIAVRVASVLGMAAPAPDPRYYHDNVTAGISIFGKKLLSIATLKVGILVSSQSSMSVAQGAALKQLLDKANLAPSIVGETLVDGVDQTYSAADATAFDGIIVTEGAESLFNGMTMSALYPAGRPSQILLDGYRWGKPIAAVGSASSVIMASGPGVYKGTVSDVAESMKRGLAIFKFTDRFPLDGQ